MYVYFRKKEGTVQEGTVQGKVENGKVYSPIGTGNIFSETGYQSSAFGSVFMFSLSNSKTKFKFHKN